MVVVDITGTSEKRKDSRPCVNHNEGYKTQSQVWSPENKATKTSKSVITSKYNLQTIMATPIPKKVRQLLSQTNILTASKSNN